MKQITISFKRVSFLGLGCSSVIEVLFSLHEALGLISCAGQKEGVW